MIGALASCREAGDVDAETPAGTRKRGGGPLIAWDVDLIPLASSATGDSNWAAISVGLTGVERFVRDGSTVRATAIAAPSRSSCDESLPVALAAVDVDYDDDLDLVVADGGCGYWLVKQIPEGTLAGQPEQAPAGAVPTLPHLKWVSSGGVPSGRLFAAEVDRLQVLDVSEGEWTRVDSVDIPPPWLSTRTNTLMVRLPPSAPTPAGVLIQQRGAFQPVVLRGERLELGVALPWGVTGTDQLAAFDGFDHLHEIASCDLVQLVGVGVYEGPVGTTPTPLVSLRFMADGVEVREIDARSVDSIGLAAREGELWIGMLQSDGARMSSFTTARLDDACMRLDEATSRTMPIVLQRPSETLDPERARSMGRFRGTRIVGNARDDGLVEFTTYDGRDLHVFEVETAAPFEVEYRRFEVYRQGE